MFEINTPLLEILYLHLVRFALSILLHNFKKPSWIRMSDFLKKLKNFEGAVSL